MPKSKAQSSNAKSSPKPECQNAHHRSRELDLADDACDAPTERININRRVEAYLNRDVGKPPKTISMR